MVHRLLEMAHRLGWALAWHRVSIYTSLHLATLAAAYTAYNHCCRQLLSAQSLQLTRRSQAWRVPSLPHQSSEGKED